MEYIKCNKCGCVKTCNRNPYCKICSREYFSNRRKEKAKKELSTKELKSFVDNVIANNYNIEFAEINDIITFYNQITRDIEEFSHLPSNQQIVNMWNTLYDYCKR